MAERAFVAVVANSGGAVTRCQSCGAPIRFFRTYPKNQAIPFDAHVLVLEAEDDVLGVEYLDRADTHFRTCPDAARWRRPRSAAR